MILTIPFDIDRQKILVLNLWVNAQTLTICYYVTDSIEFIIIVFYSSQDHFLEKIYLIPTKACSRLQNHVELKGSIALIERGYVQ